MSKSVPRPWLLNLVARALRILAKKKSAVRTEPPCLANLTKLSPGSVQNALDEMQARSWIDAAAKDSWNLTHSFPIPPDYFSSQALCFIGEIASWPGPPARPRQISLLWAFARISSTDRVAFLSHRDIAKECAWAKDDPSNINKTIRTLESDRRLRVIGGRIGRRWDTNRYQFAGPSGFLPQRLTSIVPIRPKPGDLQREILRIVERAKGPYGYDPVPTTQLINETGRHKKTIYVSAKGLVKLGKIECVPQRDAIGRRLPHHWRRLQTISPSVSTKKRNPNYNWISEHTAAIRSASRTLKPVEMARQLKQKKIPLPNPAPPSWRKLEDIPTDYDWPKLLNIKITRNWFDQVRFYYKHK